MTVAKHDLIESYLDQHPSGDASREEIERIAGRRCIVGYGWAVYVTETPDMDGIDYALFGDGYKSDGTNVGWAGYSGTTTQHLQEIKAALEARDASYAVVDAQMRSARGWAARGGRGDRPALSEIPDEDFRAFVRTHRVEKREYTGHFYRK